jgi:hypothetical protein
VVVARLICGICGGRAGKCIHEFVPATSTARATAAAEGLSPLRGEWRWRCRPIIPGRWAIIHCLQGLQQSKKQLNRVSVIVYVSMYSIRKRLCRCLTYLIYMLGYVPIQMAHHDPDIYRA